MRRARSVHAERRNLWFLCRLLGLPLDDSRLALLLLRRLVLSDDPVALGLIVLLALGLGGWGVGLLISGCSFGFTGPLTGAFTSLPKCQKVPLSGIRRG